MMEKGLDRVLAGTVYLFAGLSVLHWADVNRLLHGPPGCGNAFSDPYRLLATFFGPLAAVGLAALFARRIRRRRRPCFPWLVLPLLFGTMAELIYEARWFGGYGIEIYRIWWLPRL